MKRSTKKQDKAASKAAVKQTKKNLAGIVGKALASAPRNGELPTGKKARKAQAPATPAPTATPTAAVLRPKRISHLELGPRLVREGASEAEILKAFTDSFNGRGVTDQEWINGRIKIYMNIARKKVAAEEAAAAAATAPAKKGRKAS